MRLDLESQKQIRKAAAEVNAYQEVVDVLSNNAAIIAQDYPTIEDGIKSQFMAEKELRMVNASSRGHWLSGIRWENPNFQYGAAYNAWQSYRQSKTANMLFYASLAGKIGPQGAQSFSLHPGTINTNLVNSVLKQDVKYLDVNSQTDGDIDVNSQTDGD
ncbi:hypothetical protein MMC26_004662 [Xylographa opegraphella]|nr:hypothetical protein [Xylographa opegraphella]